MTRRIFIECTKTYLSGHATGIQRVVRNFVTQGLRLAPAAGVEWVPVMLRGGGFVAVDTGKFTLRPPGAARQRLDAAYLRIVRTLAGWIPLAGVRRFLLAHRSEFGLAWILYLPFAALDRARIGAATRAGAPALQMSAGDILFLADSSWSVDWDTVRAQRARGVRVVALMFDMIPVTHPQFFPPQIRSTFEPWFRRALADADALVCISDFTRQQVLAHCRSANQAAPRCEVVHLGYDVVGESTTAVAHLQLHAILEDPEPLFLCVGTLEPRKNHAVVIDAFDRLWAQGSAARLLLVGRNGWLSEDLVARIRQHPRLGRRLFWLDDVGDADLDHAYRRAQAVIAPSLVEGFGLPIVEGLAKGRPVLASDIPVFREIVGRHARFFDPHDPAQLAALVEVELRDPPAGEGEAFRWPSWSDATRTLLDTLRALGPAAP